ncbi:hypothetical protein AgCh_017985 [Apium graveolens]
MATAPSPDAPPTVVPPVSSTAPIPPTLSPPAPSFPLPDPNANSPAATPNNPPQTPSSANSTALPSGTPPSPAPKHSIITSPPPEPSITSPPPEQSIITSPPPKQTITSPPPKQSLTSPPPEQSIQSPPAPPQNSIISAPPPRLVEVPPPSEISPPPLPPTKAPPKFSSPTTSPLPPSVPFVASPPSPPSPITVSPSPPTPTVKSPSPEPPPSPSKKPVKHSSHSESPPSLPPEKSPPAQTKRPKISTPPPPTPVKSPHSAPPSPPISSNMSFKVSPPPSPKIIINVSPPLSVNPTTNKSTNMKSTESAGIGTGGTIAIVLVLGLILISLIGAAVFCLRKRKRKFTLMNNDHIIPTSLSCSPKSDSALLKVQAFESHNGSYMGDEVVYLPTESNRLDNSRPWFTYSEIVDATNGFSKQNLLGEGGFGCVYKGYLVDGREIAVKQLNVGGGQGEREFKAEVEIISRVHHRHLVSLVGYCISENQRLLVYDYVPNNNLYFHLQEEGRPVMEWSKRIKVAAGAARGIAYLHEDCHPRIIHRDIKSSNILLDNSFEARVSDFGLAKLAWDVNTHVTTRVIGTFGYMAPEYAASGMLTEKSDVYSFGVVLLELITGRKPVDPSQPSGNESLVEWARPLLSAALDSGDLKGLADPGLGINYVDHEMFKIIEVAAACIRHAAAKRPRMGQVVREFDSMAASDLTNGMKVGESEIFNFGFKSAEIRFFQRMQVAMHFWQEYSAFKFRGKLSRGIIFFSLYEIRKILRSMSQHLIIFCIVTDP